MSDVFQPGFGAQLCAARESLGMSVADVSAKLKLTPRQIEAIEVEDLEHLPTGVFLRGFVRNYARLVGLDADALLIPVAVEEAVAETITVKSEGVRFVTRGVRRWVLLPGIVLLVFLVLVAVLYEWLRSGETGVLTPPQTVVVAPQVSALPALPSALPSAADVVPAASIQPEVAAMPSAQPSVAAAAPVAPVLPSPPSVASTVKPAATPPAVPPASPQASSGEHSLRFEAAQSAWVSVVDAKGRRFSKLVVAGGLEVFKGEPPFRLVVGEAAQVRLSFDGHNIDLTPYIGQKVARLTLE